MHFQIGDLVIINENPYQGCFEDDIGIIEKAYTSDFFYVRVLKHDDVFLLKHDEFGLYKLTED